MKFTLLFPYSVMALLIGFAVLSLVIVVPNARTILWTLNQPGLSFADHVLFIGTLYGGLVTNFTLTEAISMIVVAVLFGINVSLLTFYVRSMRKMSGARRTSMAGLSGLLSGLLGIGCASCGSVVIVGLLGQFGAGAFITALPYGGSEFSFLAVAILSYTTYTLVKRIRQPAVCEITVR